MKKNFLYIIIAILVVTQVFSYWKISRLQEEVEIITNNISSMRNVSDSQMNSIYRNVDEKLKKQASYIEYAERKIEKVNKTDLTVTITYNITPKEVNANTKLSLSFKGEKRDMERNENTFSLVTTASIFENEIFPDIIITEGSTVKTEKNDSICVYSLKEEVFPVGSVYFSGASRGSITEYEPSGSLSADFKEYDDTMDDTMDVIKYTKARVVMCVGDKIISDKPVKLEELDGYMIDDKIPLKKGDAYTMTVVLTDDLNLEHHFVVDSYVADSSEQGRAMPPNEGEEKICKLDGTVVWTRAQ